MAKQNTLDFAFYEALKSFYLQNKGRIKKNYRELTKKFLDFNDPDNRKSFLRRPQFEALEMYIFIKEFLDNEQLHKIFSGWFDKRNKFADRGAEIAIDSVQQISFYYLTGQEYKSFFSMMEKNAEDYPNYIYALTMGTGKTILMATCIFYEFLLANKFPKDKKYCHNALVFAPDKTVLQSLREIQTFDKSKVIPPEYARILDTNVKFHFLDESGITLNTIDKSDFNIIISNTQKIILKKQHKEATPIDKLFNQVKPKLGTVYNEAMVDLYNFDEEAENEGELLLNQRFEKLTRLEQLGIYVDEAHHLFGKNLADSMLKNSKKSSLRTTINELANSLSKLGTRVVACYNYTGTPYVGNQVLPEVVYTYGIREAINNGYLKEVDVRGYDNIKSEEFIREVINDFWSKYNGKTYEGMKPKLAIFAATIDEVRNELRPAVERALADMGISIDKVLVNVGDPKETTNDDIKEFNNLDTISSDKQFIMLVNKGREGWNCRSLFGVALFREPDSRIFVLQATMRCLRAIGDIQETASVYLSKNNYDILDNELRENFRISISDIQKKPTTKKEYYIRPVEPPRKLKIKRIKHRYEMKEKKFSGRIDFEFEKVNIDKYKATLIEKKGLLNKNNIIEEDVSHIKINRKYSKITFVAEIAKYFNLKCLYIEKLLEDSVQGLGRVLEFVNQYNEILYDIVIPKIFNELYEVKTIREAEDDEIELVKEPKDGYYKVLADDKLVVGIHSPDIQPYKNKSFHLDYYCFDSQPEKKLFLDYLMNGKVKEIYFTGMLTANQTDFYIQYIDPESHTVRSYYPDFVSKLDDGTWEIIEVKADYKVDDIVVKAKKEYAEELANESNMRYVIKSESEIMGKNPSKGQQFRLPELGELISSDVSEEYNSKVAETKNKLN